MTFSIVARCPDSGQFGIAISSSSPAVAARCSFARAGVGAVATQNVTNPALGPAVLDLMALGEKAEAAGRAAIAAEKFPHYRQLLVIGAEGAGFIQSGAQALGTWSSASGKDCVSAGNLLADANVPAAIVDGFEATGGALGDRLIAALRAGLAAGGEAGPVHSAGLLVVDRQAWPYAELRCDWTEDCPIAAIATAWEIYKPQAEDYVTRALNPTAAPSYGVPGDE
ncbi:DUF1028 domain-containing protein [Aliiruegeria lutimaris]|uniref:Uncharacterized conserved protein, Ntn-hydrolase superfamily n=1 Tax=Aliiruegeria lutimaris TaxID=571298 RepID=A0A1G9IEW1_9RHOB|nr:DUF1028 domain-containing protein [Aliiruegeria lutimaris]SDL23737.1 Uncharacterized conserved protein, Ntn-hydrolase superfamily [Aliiruegeria lutimaris]